MAKAGFWLQEIDKSWKSTVFWTYPNRTSRSWPRDKSFKGSQGWTFWTLASGMRSPEQPRKAPNLIIFPWCCIPTKESRSGFQYGCLTSKLLVCLLPPNHCTPCAFNSKNQVLGCGDTSRDIPFPNLPGPAWRSAASCSAIFLSRPINRSASSLGRRDETCALITLAQGSPHRCTKQEALKTEVSLQLCPNQKRWTDKSAKYHQGLAAGHVFPHTCSVLSSSSTLHLASPDMPKHQQLQNASAWSQRASRMPYNAYWVCITGHCNGKALVGTWYQHAMES